jgi:hypothetical protein
MSLRSFSKLVFKLSAYITTLLICAHGYAGSTDGKLQNSVASIYILVHGGGPRWLTSMRPDGCQKSVVANL